MKEKDHIHVVFVSPKVYYEVGRVLNYTYTSIGDGSVAAGSAIAAPLFSPGLLICKGLWLRT